ncbi:MAG: hypothetical protein ORN24_06520 [Burkholderiales bacterium]|nr:hypothetical protein [Burkholderiales bacterium]
MLEVNNNVEIKSGLEWIKAAFRIFREKPIHFVLLTILNYVLATFLPFLSPIFVAKYAKITLKIEQNKKVLLSDLYSEFFSDINVVKLTILYAILFLAVGLFELMLGKNLTDDVISFAGFSFNFNFYSEIIKLIFMLVMGLCMWFAPLICLFNQEITPFKAMLLSFKGCSSNVLAFLVFFLISTALLVLATIPFFLGWIILFPTMNIVTLFIYRNVFHEISEGTSGK